MSVAASRNRLRNLVDMSANHGDENTKHRKTHG